MVIARRQTLVQLSDELIHALDARAARDRKSRSAVIREAVEGHLHDEIEAEKVRQYVEAYRRMPQTEEEVAWTRGMARLTLARLDAEKDEDW
jgi:metal-responsive CopG/Arc/MetJ family transcriptional regulator